MIRAPITGTVAVVSSPNVTAKLVHMPVTGANVTLATVAPGATAPFAVDLKPGERIKLDKGGTGVSVTGTGQIANDSEVVAVFVPRVGDQQTLSSSNASAIEQSFQIAMGETGDVLQLLAQ